MVQKRNNNLNLEILLVLIKQETHLREISRILKASHSTVLREINKLARENILDYKKQGKNNVYFIKNNLLAKQFIYKAERYKIIKLLEKYPKLTVIFDEVLKNINENLVIIFGSYAKFIAKENSDIDLYIGTDNRNLKEKLKGINSKINLKTGKFDLDSLLIKEIIKNHIILRGIEEFYEKIKFFEKT